MPKSNTAKSRRSGARPERRAATTAFPRGVVAYLYAAAFAAAFSAVAYELLLASYATFLMGASVFQYSLVLSLMMASMGLGALISDKRSLPVLPALLGVELGLAVLAAVAMPVLYVVFATGLPARFVVGLFVVMMGAMIGMEIPLLSRLGGGEKSLSRLLFFDYLGGFLGGILFPLFLVPALGLFRVAGVLALLNAVIGAVLLIPFRRHLGRQFSAWALGAGVVLALALVAFVQADSLRLALETSFFGIQHR